MSRDSATLLDMLKAARLAVEFREGMEKRAFLNDPKTQSAILHQLLILGEAAKRLSQEFRTQHQKIPWKQIAWKTAKSDMPRLIKQLEPLAPTKEEDE